MSTRLLIGATLLLFCAKSEAQVVALPTFDKALLCGSWDYAMAANSEGQTEDLLLAPARIEFTMNDVWRLQHKDVILNGTYTIEGHEVVLAGANRNGMKLDKNPAPIKVLELQKDILNIATGSEHSDLYLQYTRQKSCEETK